MRIYLGADHGGYLLKEKIKNWLQEWDYFDYKDLGSYKIDDEDDYPDFAFKVGEAVSQDPYSIGILVCRSATGMVIAANKVKGIRAIDGYDQKVVLHAREHNFANILALSGDWLNDETAQKIIKTFLTTPYSDKERHRRRVEKISNYEDSH